jgi:hypothetical protein
VNSEEKMKFVIRLMWKIFALLLVLAALTHMRGSTEDETTFVVMLIIAMVAYGVVYLWSPRFRDWLESKRFRSFADERVSENVPPANARVNEQAKNEEQEASPVAKGQDKVLVFTNRMDKSYLLLLGIDDAADKKMINKGTHGFPRLAYLAIRKGAVACEVIPRAGADPLVHFLGTNESDGVTWEKRRKVGGKLADNGTIPLCAEWFPDASQPLTLIAQ